VVLKLLYFAFVDLYLVLHGGQHLACVDLHVEELLVHFGIIGFGQVAQFSVQPQVFQPGHELGAVLFRRASDKHGVKEDEGFCPAGFEVHRQTSDQARVGRLLRHA